MNESHKFSLDRPLRVSNIKRVVTHLFLIVANSGLTFFLISVLADNLMEYKKAFWITAPIILTLTYLIGKVIFQLSSRTHQSGAVLFVIMIATSILNLVILSLNYSCWIDLFDGTTDTMFP